MRHVIDNTKLKGKLGGKRPGAGRKPDYLKRLGVTPVNAAQIMARYDEHEAWGWFLKHPNASIRLNAWQYLTDRRDGNATSTSAIMLRERLIPNISSSKICS